MLCSSAHASRAMYAGLHTRTSKRTCTVPRKQRSHGLKCRTVNAQVADSLAGVCKQLDELLVKEDDASEEAAVQLAAAAKQQGLLVAFGSAQQVPKALYSVEELRLNKIEPLRLLAPVDNSLNDARRTLLVALVAAFVAAGVSGTSPVSSLLGSAMALILTLTLDQVVNAGGVETLVLDTLARVLKPSYRDRVAYHEAGHFLVAYLLGILPRAYTLSSLDAFVKYRALNVQAGCQFCDLDFRQQLQKQTLSSQTLGSISCIALAGVVTEYLRFGQAEGGIGDVAQLDGLFRALQFTQAKADGEVRWAVLNVAALLRRHSGLHDKLAAALGSGQSVGQCLRLIEEQLAGSTSI